MAEKADVGAETTVSYRDKQLQAQVSLPVLAGGVTKLSIYDIFLATMQLSRDLL